MRILITLPFPVDESPAGPAVQTLAAALLAAGHGVRVLALDRRPPAAGALVIRTVTCRADDAAADLDFDIPRFAADESGAPTFDSLSEDQLARYREAIRQRLDREVDAFDPHIIHVEYVWLLGQLVLETGVPYVARLWGPEVAGAPHAPRIRGLAQQAAENAGRIIVADAAQAARAASLFEVGPERIALLPPGEAAAGPYVELYRTVLTERFGSAPAD